MWRAVISQSISCRPSHIHWFMDFGQVDAKKLQRRVANRWTTFCIPTHYVVSLLQICFDGRWGIRRIRPCIQWVLWRLCSPTYAWLCTMLDMIRPRALKLWPKMQLGSLNQHHNFSCIHDTSERQEIECDPLPISRYADRCMSWQMSWMVRRARLLCCRTHQANR